MKRTNTKKLALLIAVFSVGIAFANFPISEAQAHSGGLDKNGCHKDSKRGKHCHRRQGWIHFPDKKEKDKYIKPSYIHPR